MTSIYFPCKAILLQADWFTNGVVKFMGKPESIQKDPATVFCIGQFVPGYSLCAKVILALAEEGQQHKIMELYKKFDEAEQKELVRDFASMKSLREVRQISLQDPQAMPDRHAALVKSCIAWKLAHVSW